MVGEPSTVSRSSWVDDTLLWLVIPLVVVAAYGNQVFLAMGADGCDGTCDLTLIGRALSAFPWAMGASVAAAIVLAVILRSRRRPTFWAPLAGIVLVVLSAIVIGSLVQAGLAPLLERNSRIEHGQVAEPSPPPASPLGAWHAPGSASPQLTFTTTGALTGYDGCNAIHGTWTDDDDVITFHDLVLTESSCPGADTWLSFGRSAIISNGALTIRDEDGGIIGALVRD